MSEMSSSSNQNQDEAIIKVRGLHKYFGALHVIKGVDLTLKRGEGRGLIGESGAGKSTTAMAMARYVFPVPAGPIPKTISYF